MLLLLPLIISAAYDVKIRRLPRLLSWTMVILAVITSALKKRLAVLALATVLLLLLLYIGAIGGGDFKALLYIAALLDFHEFLAVTAASLSASIVFIKVKNEPAPLLLFALLSTLALLVLQCLL